MDITDSRRDKGVYVVRQTGTLTWQEDHGTWRGHGVHLELMAGRQLLAVCKLEAPQGKADELGETVAEQIEPWVQTLRYQAVVEELRVSQRAFESAVERFELAEGTEGEEGAENDVLAYAVGEAAAAGDADGRLQFGRLVGLIRDRYQRDISHGLRMALAHAPDVAAHPIHPAWELPAIVPGAAGKSVARLLLRAWAEVRDLRDPLIAWAVQEAGLTRTEVQQVTSVSRSTINRILPEA